MRVAILAWVWASLASGVFAETTSTNRILKIDVSSMKLPGGKATLTIGPLKRTNDTFCGTFQMKVTPYFYKNEKGTLAILITDESIAKAGKGLTVEITGTAKDSGNGETRRIDAVATPVDNDHGMLKLWFMADERKMTFETSYRFENQ